MKLIKLKLWMTGLVASVFLGCVPTEPVVISTNPIGATIYADGTQHGVSPQTIDLRLDSDHIITIVKDGYVQETIEINRVFKKDKQIKNAIQSGINAVRVFGDPLRVASAVIGSHGTNSPNNFTFEKNTMSVVLKKIE